MDDSQVFLTKGVYSAIYALETTTIFLVAHFKQSATILQATYTAYLWDQYFIYLIHSCFPTWSVTMLHNTPFVVALVSFVFSCVIKPPYWTSFDTPMQENRQLLLYLRQLMLLSYVQLNGIMKWQFSWEWLECQGFHHIWRIITNSTYPLSLIFDYIQHSLLKTRIKT